LNVMPHFGGDRIMPIDSLIALPERNSLIFLRFHLARHKHKKENTKRKKQSP